MLRKGFLLLLFTMAAVSGADQLEARIRMAKKQMSRNGVFQVLADTAAAHGLPAGLLRSFAKIESGFKPWVQTGSYKGLFQLSSSEFKKHGGQGSIWNAKENANAFANLLKANAKAWEKETGRAPSGSELYLMHQQGKAGAKAHLANPDKPAWQNVRKFYGSERMAKKAIWGNVPTQYRKEFGNVDNLTSRQFTQMWESKVNGGDPGDIQMAMRGTPPLPTRSDESAALERYRNNGYQNLQDASIGSTDGSFDAGNGVKFGGPPIDAETGRPLSVQPISPVGEQAPAKAKGDGWKNRYGGTYLGADSNVPMPEQNPMFHGDISNDDQPISPVGGTDPDPALPAGGGGSSSPLRRQGTGEGSAAGSSPYWTPDRTDDVFGKPFGELFQNQSSNPSLDSGIFKAGGPQPNQPGNKMNVPAAPPLFKQLFSGLFGGI